MKKTPGSPDTVLYVLEIDIPYVETDPNQMFRLAWRGRKAKFDKIKTSVSAVTAGKRPVKPLEKFTIAVTRHASKYLDWDNYVASLKPLIDGLVMAGVIKDDNWEMIRHVELEQVKTKVGVKKRLVVRVQELSGGSSTGEHLKADENQLGEAGGATPSPRTVHYTKVAQDSIPEVAHAV